MLWEYNHSLADATLTFLILSFMDAIAVALLITVNSLSKFGIRPQFWGDSDPEQIEPTGKSRQSGQAEEAE
jgi:hypothetical protein